jgi:uncharacterized membrane protein
VAVFLAAIGIGLLVYPFLLESLLGRLGVRASCGILLLVSFVSLAVAGRMRSAIGLGAWPGLAIAAVLGIGAISGWRGALLLVPAVVYLGLAEGFRRSLDREDSIIERCARLVVPAAPEFIRSYCRGVTWLGVAFFYASAIAIAALALAGTAAAWRTFTGWGIYVSMLLISGLEFFVRKTWFRYYFHGGPFDRLWSQLFPAENTERGRRSAEYIRRFREEAAQSARGRG